MLKRFGWVAILIGVGSCLLLSCGGGSGSSTTSTTSMYVVMQGSAQIFGYRSSITTGGLSTINGSPFAAEPASAIVIDPAHAFAYVANNNSLPGGTNPDGTPANQILRFTINLNGSLASMGGGAVATGVDPVAMVMDSGGKFLFVANQNSGNISVFSVGPSAALQEVAGSPFSFPANGAIPNTTTANPVALGVFNSILYVVNGSVPGQVNGQVSVFKFDSSGVLTPALSNIAPLQVGNSPSAIAVSSGANGNFVYVANSGTNNVSGFTIDTTVNVGDLIPIANSPFSAGLHPVAAAVDPSHQFLYVVNQNSNSVTGYRITLVNGDLTPLSNSPFSAGVAPVAIGISPTNKFLYVSNNSSNTISSFSIDPASGNLASVSSAISTGSLPAGIAFGK